MTAYQKFGTVLVGGVALLFAGAAFAGTPQGGDDTPGVYDTPTKVFALWNNLASMAPPGAPAEFFPFNVGGLPDDYVPVSGDWNGDGTDTIGVYDTVAKVFALRNSNSNGAADAGLFQFNVGAGTQYIPITGDWNDDGTDTIGVYDPNTGVFALRNSNSTGAPDAGFFLYKVSASTDLQPLAGDWNGDGIDTVGLYDSVNTVFALRDSNSGGFPDAGFFLFNIGAGNYQGLAGDFNGSSSDTIGVYDKDTGVFALRNSNDNGFPDAAFALYKVSADTDIPALVGNWDGQ